MTASDLCCTHQQPRFDSPEPPSRPLVNIDGIFAAAALPEDHPHALKFPERKAGLDPGIVRSPNIASRLRLQFRRRSMRSLSKAKDYDHDAHAMTSQDVLEDVKEVTTPKEQSYDYMVRRPTFGSATATKPGVKPSATGTGFSPSPLRSLEWIKPLIQKPSDLTISSESYNLTGIANRVAARQPLHGASNAYTETLPPLSKALSSPNLFRDAVDLPRRAQRSRSELDLSKPLSMLKRGQSSPHVSMDQGCPSVSNADHPADYGSEKIAPLLPALHIEEPTEVESSDPLHPYAIRGAIASEDKDQPENHLHLHDMDISQQLRSLSQMSDPFDEDALSAPQQPWNVPQAERWSNCLLSSRSRHARQDASNGVDSATIPLSWGRVRSPAASSVYSRPSSADATAIDKANAGPEKPAYEVPMDLNASFADWPLKPSASVEETYRALGTVSERSAGSEKRNKPLPPTPLNSGKDSGAASFVTSNDNSGGSVKLLSPPNGVSSLPSKSSSSTLSKKSRQSKFKERFSPPKRTVRKRRSIFKFLRPDSRKQQIRSISTPVLSVRSRKHSGAYDGPTDDPALLTVQYELEEQPANRSMSASQLSLGRYSNVANRLDASHALHRSPTMADYERNLSVAGDDRRRPSSINLHKLQEIQEDDRRHSSSIRRRLSRARPLKDDANPLMASALEKHQKEKALFRSASKLRESHRTHQPAPEFSSSSFIGTETSVPSLSSHGRTELVESSEEVRMQGPTAHSRGATHLSPPAVTAGPSSRVTTGSSGAKDHSDGATTKDQMSVKSLSRPKRIGTSLASWSRYPSHSRFERCGSAGRADAVIARDFAVDINPEEIGSDDAETGSPKSALAPGHAKAILKKSRSLTFGGIARYYSNLFYGSGFAGKNRRTSVTTGGRLDYPELEMIPPQLPADHHHFSSIRDHVREDADRFLNYVKEEEGKFEDYVRKEEAEFEGFVRRETGLLEGFVKKEEGKLKDYVKEEEGKFRKHQHRHSSGKHEIPRPPSPFREGSLFGTSHSHSQGQSERGEDALIGPNDNSDKVALPDHAGLALDGAASAQKSIAPSKAEIWSDIYKECVGNRPNSVEIRESTDTAQTSADSNTKVMSMPPPALKPLKPIKPRSPEQLKQVDEKATIRRYPSVTVVDDRKGHWRSVSLISVKTSRSTGMERPSVTNLSQLFECREKNERDDLMRGLDVGSEKDIFAIG